MTRTRTPLTRNAANPLLIDDSKPVTLYLARHGHYDLDPSYPLEVGPSLSSVGRRQAARLARYFDTVRLDLIYVSTMTRAAETAAPVIERQKRARVVRTGDIAEIHEGHIARYRISPRFGHERRRVERFIGGIPGRHKPGQKLLAVCHANVIRYSLARALGAPPKEGARLQVHNTGLSVVECYHTGRVAFTVERINYSGHLTPRMVT